jgi:hypothetical protein
MQKERAEMTRIPWGKIAVVVGVFSALMVGVTTTATAEDNHAFPFLRTGVGARAWGMGNAYVAIAGDATSAFFNPAGLSKLNKWGFATMMSVDMAFDRKHNYAALAGNFDFGALGFSWVNSGIDDVSISEGQGGGAFNYSQNVFALSYANQSCNFRWGVNFLILNHDVNGISNTGVGGDLGFQWDFHKEATLGLVGQHFGITVGEDKVPANYRLGVGIHPEMLEGFTFPFEIQKTQHRDDIAFRVGGEYAYVFENEDYGTAIRAGVDDGAFSVGAGLRFKQFMLDYAYITEKEDFLGENHKFSLIGNF